MKRAFTLIEMIITIAIVAVVTTAGIGVSLNTTRRKVLDNEKEKLVEILKQARTNALAGKKDPGCSSADQLKGWKVVVSSSDYTLSNLCGILTFSKSTNFQSGVYASVTGSVMFIPVTGSVDSPVAIKLTSDAGSRSVTVNTVGGIE